MNRRVWLRFLAGWFAVGVLVGAGATVYTLSFFWWV